MPDPHLVDQVVDLAVIGAGISSAYTLRALLDQLRDQPPRRPIRIAVLDPGPDFFGGIAYGARSGSTARIITPLDEFLAPPERDQFINWLRQHAASALVDFEARQGMHSSSWLEAHRGEIAAGDCGHLCLPRSLFGQYVEATVGQRIACAERDGLIDLALIRTCVTSLDRRDDSFVLDTDGAGTLRATQVLLAVGTPPGQRLFDGLDTDALLIDTPYLSSLTDTVDRVAQRVTSVEHRPPRIVIIGANATMLDLLYQFEDHPGIAAAAPTYCVLSRRGVLPSRLETPGDRPTNLPHLERLAQQAAFDANDVHAAVVADLDYHGSPPDDAGWLTPAINQAIGSLVLMLSPPEQRIFANSTGTDIGRTQRRAGVDYYQIVDELDQAGRLDRQEASFENGSFEAGATEPATMLQGAVYDVVINACGSAGLQPGPSSLLDSVLGHGLATATESQAGLVVDDRFEAYPGLFVMGPLLAGNVIGGRPIWHLEHAGRIIKMSATLGRQIGQSFL